MTRTAVFLMDPIDRIDIHGDSTFVLMQEWQARGHRVLHALPRDLIQRGAQVFALAREVEVRAEVGNHYTWGETVLQPLDEAQVVFMRQDPPFDLEYLVTTWLLDRVDQSRVVMVNRPQGVRNFNEKLSALRWPELMPPTMITANRGEIRQFIDTHEHVVVKPLLNAGGTGIIMLHHKDRNIGSVLDMLTEEGATLIEAQKYLPAVTEGDKRIVLLDGQPVGAVNRVPAADDIRANMHVGGKAVESKLTDRDKEICAAVGPVLHELGLVFTGLDVIGGFLTEINVTSPTGLQEINRFDGVKLEAQIIDWVEARSDALRDAKG